MDALNMPKGVFGWQPGNEEWKKNQLFLNTLKRAIVQEDGKRLRAAAEKLLTKAAAGEPWAIEMLANRLDGRPATVVQTPEGQSVVYEVVKRIIVDPEPAKVINHPHLKIAKG